MAAPDLPTTTGVESPASKPSGVYEGGRVPANGHYFVVEYEDWLTSMTFNEGDLVYVLDSNKLFIYVTSTTKSQATLGAPA